MSHTNALVPVPFYAPAQTGAGNSGALLTFTPRSGPAGHRERTDASDDDTGLIYDQRGGWIGVDQPGRVVSIWI